MKPIRKFLGAAFVAGLTISASIQSAVAEGYANKPIEMIIGFKPGGFSDAMARKLSEPLTEALGQPKHHLTYHLVGHFLEAQECNKDRERREPCVLKG